MLLQNDMFVLGCVLERELPPFPAETEHPASCRESVGVAIKREDEEIDAEIGTEIGVVISALLFSARHVRSMAIDS